MIKDKTVLITGSTGGLGKKLVDGFLNEGFNVICLCRNLIKKKKNFLKKNRRKVKVINIDLTNFVELKKTLISNLKNVKKIDVLINNAGIGQGSIIEMTSINKIKEVFDINFFAQIQITQILLKYLKKSKEPSIINIGSIYGIYPERGTLAYGCSKAALHHATKIMAKEFAAYNITVNSIAPSVLDVGMSKNMDKNSKNYLIENSYLKNIVKSKDVVRLALFLALNNSKNLNGQIIKLDGGF